MTQLILKRAPIGWNQEDYDVLEDGVVVGRRTQGPPLDVGDPKSQGAHSGARIRANARGGDGGVQGLVAAKCIQVLDLHPARPEAASRSNTSSSPSGSMYFGS